MIFVKIVPEAPPSAIKVVAINSTAVKISWKPPDPQKINGINQGYKIEAHSYDIERNRYLFILIFIIFVF